VQYREGLANGISQSFVKEVKASVFGGAERRQAIDHSIALSREANRTPDLVFVKVRAQHIKPLH
jgi:hypothetical protein